MLKKLFAIFTRKRQENDMNDELRFHLEREFEQNIAGGMATDEARRQALISFGGVDQTRESMRDVHRGRFLDAFIQDVRYGLRLLRKTPGFTTVAVLTLALGIGANSAIFSLIDAVIFRSLPIRNPENLVVFEWHARQGPATRGYRTFGDCEDDTNRNPRGCSLPLPFFKAVQPQANVFSHIAAFTGGESFNLSGNGPARMIRGEFISGDYFLTLDLRAHLGRLLSPADDSPEAPPVAVLNYTFWQNAFGGSQSAIGKTIRLNGVSFMIVGVTEPKFDALTLSNKYDLWVPLSRRPSLIPRWNARQDQMDSFWLIIVGRVKPDVSVTQAQAAVSLMFRNEMLKGEKPIFKPESDPTIRLASAAQTLGGSQDKALKPL